MALRIEDYGLIGDTHTAALVGIDGSIDWLCLPAFDSQACFSSLLGTEENGFWRIGPADGSAKVSRGYRGPTLVLETEFATGDGTARLIDFMPIRSDASLHIVRVVEGVAGSVRMRTTFKPRFDYGHTLPWVMRADGAISATAGPDALVLRSEIPLEGHDFEHSGEFTIGEGETASFVLSWHASWESSPEPVDPASALSGTEAWWREWSGRSTYEGGWKDEVERSLITLKALTYAPTGGVVAAATTSLPEFLGGVRNWDYRFCWIRDAALTLDALMAAGYVREATAWRDWVMRAVAGDPEDLQIMYGLRGERRLAEYELDWLPGYEGSRPVRVGNAASDQLQLDVYGELTDAMYRAHTLGMPPTEHGQDLMKVVMDWLESHWRDPDDGLWEVRGPRRQFVHSKVMAWVAADRMARWSGEIEGAKAAARFERLRDEIHAEVCDQGYDPDRNTFTQYYGSTQLDAALLLIPQVGFLPPSDPRVIGTVEAVQRELVRDGFVMRYIPDEDAADGLPPGEGAFLACSFWLVQDLALLGRREEALELFERLLSLRNDLGLYSEEYDAANDRLIGNTPQAFTHLTLIAAAVALSDGSSAGG